MPDLFGIREALSAFWIEFWLLALAGLCVAAAIALLSIRVAPALLEKWTGLATLKRTLAYVLFGVAVGCLCWFGGFRQARRLAEVAALRARIETDAALKALRDRRDAAIDMARKAEAELADKLAAAEAAALESQRKQDAAASHHDSEPGLSVDSVQRLDAIGRAGGRD